MLTVVFAALLFLDLHKNGDFDVFFAAGLRYAEGARVHLSETSAFTYPAFVGALLSIFTPLGFHAVQILFFLLTFTCMFVGIRIINHKLLPPDRKSIWVFTIVIIICAKFFLAVFNNQQTDLFVFALVIIGLYYYSLRNNRDAWFFSLAVLVKSNPLFMILLPLFQRRIVTTVAILAMVVVGLILPDLIRPNMDGDPNSGQVKAYFDVPTSVIEKPGEDRYARYPVEPTRDSLFAHLGDYLDLTFSGEGPKWWQDRRNHLNQSLTIAVLRFIPEGAVSANLIFLFWCCLFSGLLLVLVQTRMPDSFTLGLLFYSAFVLIGPMSSKPHFIAMYGLLICMWRDVILSPKISKLIVAVVPSLVFGFTSKGLLGDYAETLANYGHIGISGFIFWIYVYLKEFNRSNPQDLT